MGYYDKKNTLMLNVKIMLLIFLLNTGKDFQGKI